MPATEDADTVYQHGDLVILLREDPPYRSGAASLPDDGIVDEVAVERFATGDRTVRLSPREVVCVVARLAASGEDDGQIAERFDRGGDLGRRWAFKVRKDHRIPAAEPRFTDDELAQVMLYPSQRAKASGTKLRAAGVIA